MGCCGCSLQTSAIVACVFGILESIIGLSACIFLLQDGASNSPSISISIDTSGASVSHGYTSEFYGVFVSGTVINSLWLLATILLIIGIIKENATLHQIWVGMTSVVMISDVIETIVTVAIFIQKMNSYNRELDYYFYITFAVLLLLVTRSSIILWIINICLTIYTAQRATEIRRGPRPHPNTQVLIYGGQPMQSLVIPGQQVFVHHDTGSSAYVPLSNDFQPPPIDQFHNPGYRPDVPREHTDVYFDPKL